MKWTGCQAARRCTCVSSRSNERWRHVATYRADDDNPKEAFVSHQAGLDGGGSSSYIDSVILRQRDANSGWVNAADGTMEERRNFCQNWRSDVSALLTSAGVMVEWGKFTAYGLPIGLPAGDIDSDFITDTGDVDAIKTWVAAYDVRADLDLDGDIDATDGTLAEGYEGWQLGWNELSHADVANRIGYAGYHKDVNLDISHVRNRVLEPHLGRWTRRDPLGYVDGMGLYEYVLATPLATSDPFGLASRHEGTCLVSSPPQPHMRPPHDCPPTDQCDKCGNSPNWQICLDCCNDECWPQLNEFCVSLAERCVDRCNSWPPLLRPSCVMLCWGPTYESCLRAIAPIFKACLDSCRSLPAPPPPRPAPRPGTTEHLPVEAAIARGNRHNS